jgi:hypothetical protein
MTKINIAIPRVATIARKKNTPALPGHEHHTQIDATGTGTEDFPFGTPDEIVKRVLKRAARAERRKQKRDRKAAKNPKKGTTGLNIVDAARSIIDKLVVSKPAQVVPVGQTRQSYTAGQILLKSADGMQELMMARQFDGFYEERFGDASLIMAWGLANMPVKKMGAVTSLDRNWKKLRLSYQQTLPKLTRDLAQKNPKAPLMAVIQKAVELLDQELARIIYVLMIYTESIKQVRDGRFVDELNAVEVLFEDAFRLYFTGELECSKDGKTSPVQLPSSTYKVGAVFMPRITSSGLATVPGAKGPIGANALQFPWEMLDFIMAVFPLLGHEARHNVFHDIDGLEAELLEVVEKAIRKAHAEGRITFESETMQLGEQTVATIDLVVKLVCDMLGEVDADVVGGVLFSGPAFGDNMVMSFPAMMVRDGKVSTKVKLIRTGSAFHLVPQDNGDVAIVFEVHPVDYVRIYIVAAALEAIGFAKEAKKLRQLADFAVGDELPKEITYKDGDEQTDLVIKFATADLLAVASVLVTAIIETPLASQLGKSCGDLVMWTVKRQAKVDVLTDILAAGKSDLPTHIGSIFATYVGAAASQAYIQLVREGNMDAASALRLVNHAALKMVAGLRALEASQCPVPSKPAGK